MAARFEMVRGSRIASFGSSDLVRLDGAGRKRWLMQADEVLYLHPDRVRLQGPAIDVDRDPLPDVVLEVDHTTDVRRRKLDVYKESGFPEIWVLVPWELSVRAPGLTIHVRRGEGYREEEASPAFSGWQAEEIHRAAIESRLSETTWCALERAALAMGAREGTGPEDDPLMRSVLQRAYGEVYATSYRKAYWSAFEEARQEAMVECVLAMVEVRGIEVTSDPAALRELLGAPSGDAALAAALACTDADDFRRRIREQRDLRPGPSPGGGAERQEVPSAGPDPSQSRRLTGGTTIQPAPESSRPFPRRRTSSTRASSSDGVSHSTRAPSTPSSTS